MELITDEIIEQLKPGKELDALISHYFFEKRPQNDKTIKELVVMCAFGDIYVLSDRNEWQIKIPYSALNQVGKDGNPNINITDIPEYMPTIDYSTNPVSALRLLAELKDHYINAKLENVYNGWIVNIWSIDFPIVYYSSMGNTLPEAICKAALKFAAGTQYNIYFDVITGL